ncbi:MAG TPA: hypothetical protein VFB58_19025 [Chloroflexota bacterium]|nr:hypothetical protein [Chloroflexota bacterium]
MSEERGDDELRQLAEREMAEKTDMVENEAQSRELWDIPTETDETLVRQQEDEETRE